MLKYDFALVLLNQRMPETDGFKTVALLRNYVRSANVPIIFLTERDLDEEKNSEAIPAGSSRLLPKTFSIRSFSGRGPGARRQG